MATDHIAEVTENIQSFIDKAMVELRVNLRQSQPGNATIGISFEPSMVLNYVPSHEEIKRGVYVSCDGCIHVEVLSCNTETGLVHLEIYDEQDTSKRFEFFSAGLFPRMFKEETGFEYVTSKPC